jgi:hypothetical protein
MKKILYFFVFLVLGGIAFADNANNIKIFLEGNAVREEQLTYFMENFEMEGIAAGYTFTGSRADAGYTFKFRVEPYSNPEDPLSRFIIFISLILNENNSEMLSFGWPFADLEEMYEYNQFIFLRTVINIPRPEIEEPVPTVQIVQEDDSWRNKWLYIRVSADFPITFYSLMPVGLRDGVAVTDGTNAVPLDNRVVALPGATLGIELQLFKWLSIEAKAQVGWEYLNDRDIISLTAGLELKFPLKFVKHVMLEPYGAVVMPILTSKEVYDSFPMLGFGGGLQFGIKGGKAGVLFIDINYMYYGDTGIFNPFAATLPDPPVVHYQRTAIGLGLGYKFGLIKRKELRGH